MVVRLPINIDECLIPEESINGMLRAILVVESAKIVEGTKLQAFVDNVCERKFA